MHMGSVFQPQGMYSSQKQEQIGILGGTDQDFGDTDQDFGGQGGTDRDFGDTDRDFGALHTEPPHTSVPTTTDGVLTPEPARIHQPSLSHPGREGRSQL